MKYVLGGFGLLVAVLAIVCVSSFISYGNSGVDMEEGIKAQYKSNQIVYSTFTQTATAQLGVQREYAKQVQDVITNAMNGRYKDSKALALAVSESYPASLDPKMSSRIMDTIEAGYNNFANEQRMMASRVQVYDSNLRYFWSRTWLKANGYPTLNTDDYRPVLSASTQKAFETKTDEGIQF